MLRIVNKFLVYLDKHPDRNFDVTGPGKNCLIPYFLEEFVSSIDNSNCLFKYFIRTRKFLIKTLKEGFISESELPRGAPEYLEELTR